MIVKFFYKYKQPVAVIDSPRAGNGEDKICIGDLKLQLFGFCISYLLLPETHSWDTLYKIKAI